MINGKYDISTLDISKLSLDMIQPFTSEMNARRLELYNYLNGNNPETKEMREEYATLEFSRTAYTFKKRVLADGVITPEEEKEVTIALQALARVYKIKAGIDSY